MPRLVAKIYNLKTWTHEDGEFEDEQYMYDQFMVLQRYCIVNGYVEKKYTVQKLYKYYLKATSAVPKKGISKEEKINWLFMVAKYISEHEQEEIDLKEFK